MRGLICMLAMGFIVCAGAYADLADGLVGYWAFEGNPNDGSGMGNHGVIHGDPQTVSGMMGQAFDFDGDDDGVEIAHSTSLTLPDALTAACWIYPRATRNAVGRDHAGVVWKGYQIGWGGDLKQYL